MFEIYPPDDLGIIKMTFDGATEWVLYKDLAVLLHAPKYKISDELGYMKCTRRKLTAEEKHALLEDQIVAKAVSNLSVVKYDATLINMVKNFPNIGTNKKRKRLGRPPKVKEPPVKKQKPENTLMSIVTEMVGKTGDIAIETKEDQTRVDELIAYWQRKAVKQILETADNETILKLYDRMFSG